MNLKPERRLIVFYHFHKCAGSSIVKTAINNGEKLYPNQNNGNPVDPSGNLIRYWEYDKAKLHNFFDDCLHKGISFISAEWEFPNIEHVKSHPATVLITCLRDPFERLVSNFRYDYLGGYADAKSLSDYYPHHILTFRQPNYYAKMLMGTSRELEASAEKASDLLAQFDFCRLVEKGSNLLEELSNQLGWDYDNREETNVTKNRKFNPRTFLRQLKSGNFKSLARTFSNRLNIDISQERFRSENRVDYEIVSSLSDSQ